MLAHSLALAAGRWGAQSARTDRPRALDAARPLPSPRPPEYGRNFYCRYDYEGVTSAAGDALMAQLRARIAAFAAAKAADPAHTEALSPVPVR